MVWFCLTTVIRGTQQLLVPCLTDTRLCCMCDVQSALESTDSSSPCRIQTVNTEVILLSSCSLAGRRLVTFLLIFTRKPSLPSLHLFAQAATAGSASCKSAYCRACRQGSALHCVCPSSLQPEQSKADCSARQTAVLSALTVNLFTGCVGRESACGPDCARGAAPQLCHTAVCIPCKDGIPGHS